jgi:K+-sensing histidine kinase KdpD
MRFLFLRGRLPLDSLCPHGEIGHANASRAWTEKGQQADHFRKGNEVSRFQDRRWLDGLTAPYQDHGPDQDRGPIRTVLTDVLARDALPIAATLASVVLATIVLVVINTFVQLNFIPLIYMLPVVVAATRWGILPGIVAAVASAAAADFFFYPPFYSFWLSNPQDAVHLALFLFVGIVTSNLAARLKREANVLRRREKEIGDLHTFSAVMATCLTIPDLIFAVQDYLSHTLGYRAFLIASTHNTSDSDADFSVLPQEVRDQAATLAVEDCGSTIFDSRSSGIWLLRSFTPEILGYGAIAVKLAERRGADVDVIARRVGILLDEAIATLKQLKLKESIEQATIAYRAEVLRDALIGDVSHELRTPLASIFGQCSVLAQMPAVKGDFRSHALVESIQGEAGRLDDQIRLLLDATRIKANGVCPQRVWSDPLDIVNAAIKQQQRALSGHNVVCKLEKDAPLVFVDPVLVEHALGQLLGNAAKYSPPGSTITVQGRGGDHDCVELCVSDQGSGLTTAEKRELGQRCYRSDRHPLTVDGSGLGLWIARVFMVANGGSLAAESSGPNLGATISLRLPTVSNETPQRLEASHG